MLCISKLPPPLIDSPTAGTRRDRVCISVIVPVYNAVFYLDRCVRSLLGQTFADFELVLVDDGSTDGSGEICDRYAERDARVRVIHKPNGGVSSARNAGIDAAVGDYIAFVDADDYVEPCYLELLHRPEYDMSICGVRFFGDRDSVNGADAEAVVRSNTGVVEFVNNNYGKYFLTPWAKMFRRELFVRHALRFDESIRFGEDSILVMSACRHVESLVVIPDILYDYYSTDMAQRYNLSVDEYLRSVKAVERSIRSLSDDPRRVAAAVNGNRDIFYTIFFLGLFRTAPGELNKKIRDYFVRNAARYLPSFGLAYKVRKTLTVLLFRLLYRKNKC